MEKNPDTSLPIILLQLMLHVSKLIKLAEHLAVGDLEQLHDDFARYQLEGVDYEYLYWPLMDLPLLFKEWEYWKGSPVLPGYRHILPSVMKFFGLNSTQLKLLFFIGCQDTEYFNGFQLHYSSTGEEIAFNIIEFINSI